MNLLLNNKMYTYIIIGIMSLGFMHSLLYADVPKSKKNNKKTAMASRTQGATATVKGNNVLISMNNSGSFIDYHVAGSSGMKLVKTTSLGDTGMSTIFQSSLWLSAVLRSVRCTKSSTSGPKGSKSPITRSRTPLLTRLSASVMRLENNSRLSPLTSAGGRRQFSLLKAKIVRIDTPCFPQDSII